MACFSIDVRGFSLGRWWGHHWAFQMHAGHAQWEFNRGCTSFAAEFTRTVEMRISAWRVPDNEKQMIRAMHNFKLGYLWILWYLGSSFITLRVLFRPRISANQQELFPVQWFFFLPLTGGAVQCQTSRSSAGSSELGGAAGPGPLERDDQIWSSRVNFV